MDKQREDFEAYCIKQDLCDLSKNAVTGRYRNLKTRQFCRIWEDSRAVLVVDLSGRLDLEDMLETGSYDIDEEPHLEGIVDGFNAAMELATQILQDCGITVKQKARVPG